MCTKLRSREWDPGHLAPSRSSYPEPRPGALRDPQPRPRGQAPPPLPPPLPSPPGSLSESVGGAGDPWSALWEDWGQQSRCEP